MSPKAKKVTKKADRMPAKKARKSPASSKVKGALDDKDLDQIAGGLANSPGKIKLW